MKINPGYVLLDSFYPRYNIDEEIQRCDKVAKALLSLKSDVAISGRKNAKVKKDNLKRLKEKCLRYKNEIELLNVEIEKVIQSTLI
jgi:cob(I)alamin adenosyltransferase